MTDIQRYTVAPYDLLEHVPASEYPSLREVVLYADHVAAIQQAEQRGYADAMATSDEVFLSGVEQGQRNERARFASVTDEPDSHAGAVYRAGVADAIAAAVQRVEALWQDECCGYKNPRICASCRAYEYVIAAIKGGAE